MSLSHLRRHRVGLLTLGLLGGSYALCKVSNCNVYCTIYKQLPLNLLSRVWGHVHEWQLPEALKPLVLNAYVKMFKCNMEEALVKDVYHYSNLAELFRRRIRPEVISPEFNWAYSFQDIPVDPKAEIVSPCDGVVVDHGTIDYQNQTMRVKGHRVSVNSFLGVPKLPSCVGRLHYCILYLAPGDYHGFHSPVGFEVRRRRHFDAGLLLSVSNLIMNKLDDLFCLNERAVYEGRWREGYFTMTAVGATNVGSIRVRFDPDLVTNQSFIVRRVSESCSSIQSLTFDAVHLEKGDDFGEFNLGSSIVLVFEANDQEENKVLRMEVNKGERVKFGQPLYSRRCPNQT